MSIRLRWILFLWIALIHISIGQETASVEKDTPSEESGGETSSPNGVSAPDHTADDEKEKEVLGPVALTARTFGRSISDGNVWLLEFYAPWCGHCGAFAGTYAEIANVYHASDEHKIKVAKIDGDSERALASRFGIYSYPSFFIVDGWNVYEFDQGRSKKALMKFAEGGYKEQDVIPFYTSPMGPIGLMQGALISAGSTMMDSFQWLQNSLGLSPLFAGMFMFGGIFMGCFFVIVFLALAFTGSKAKAD